jgi:hypothetical protein
MSFVYRNPLFVDHLFRFLKLLFILASEKIKEKREVNKFIKFGEDIEGFNIPVLNEREVRAAAGILFLMMFISVQLVIFNSDFLLLKYAITLFLADLIIRVIINPKFSPSLIIGGLIVKNQTPEYVGAPQKKFAWKIGIVLASIMFILLVVVNAYSPITGIICLTCLMFLFFESAFGICMGCKFYSIIYKEKAQYCPGEICKKKAKQENQKTSRGQIFFIIGFIVYVFLTVYLFNDIFSKRPYELFRSEVSSTLTKINLKETK